MCLYQRPLFYFIKIRTDTWSINKIIPVSIALRGGLGRGGKDLFFTVLPESFFDKISSRYLS